MTQTIPLLPGSSAINAGDDTYCTTGSDQRGVIYVGSCDVGAFKSQGFTLGSLTGTPQSTTINTAFALPLGLTVTANDAAEPVDGGRVTFTTPSSGASAVITGSPAVIAGGTVSVTVSANETSGSYLVTASTNGAAASVHFSLENKQAILTLLAPSGALVSWDESFAWTGTSEATWYELEVQTAGGTQMFDLWYTNTSAGCESDTSCMVIPAEAVNVVHGEYQWRVRDYGGYGYGNWTGWQSFTPPANAALGDPVGALTSWDHSFQWTGVSAATYYYMQVQTASGGAVFDAWYTSGQAGCEGGTSCAITPNQALHMSSGDYRWRLLDYGGYGYGRWTAWRSFSLDVPVASVSLGEPVDELTSWDHTFRWTGFPDGTWYYLMVQTASGTAVFDAWYTSPEAGCEGDTSCGISPVQALHLANGEYQWRILDYGMYGYGNWTEWQGFTLNIPAVGGILGEPVGEKTSWDHRFDWTGYPDSTWYFLQVQELDGTPVFDAWYLSGQAGCDVDTSCGIAPAQALRLANGDYQWRILDYGAYGYGSWTPFQSFTLNITPPVVVLGEPKDTLTSWGGSYQWTGIPDGTWYLLEVQDNQGTTLLSQWYSAGTYCTDLACVVTPAETLSLPNGTYRWRILDYTSTSGLWQLDCTPGVYPEPLVCTLA